MDKPASYTLFGPDIQEFIDTGPNDPADLVRVGKRPLKIARWLRWLIAAGVLITALISGMFLGRFFL